MIPYKITKVMIPKNHDEEVEVIEEDLSTLDDNTDWKAKAQEIEQKRREDGIRSRERTKALKDKIAEFETKPQDKKDKKSDDTQFDRVNKMAMKMAGLVEADEVEFFEKWKSENGYENADIDAVLDKKGFKSELADFRTAKANQNATSNIKGEKGDSGIKNTPDYWLAKATKGDDGKIRLPEETPKELYSQILDKMASQETGSSENLKFYN